jgi:hypothetical protein
LLELANRRLVCSCEACAILFNGQQVQRYRRVPRRVERLANFQMTDAQWESLAIPISLAFFCRHSTTDQVTAMYPSPAGATESLLPLDAWQMVIDDNPVLRQLEPDVEALLVNRVGEAHEYYRVPIDECFRLVGLIRMHWRGFSGGEKVWDEIGRFFGQLRERAHA